MNMNWEKSIKIGFVIISLSFIWAVLKVDNLKHSLNKKTTEMNQITFQRDSLQKLSDSLSMELFPKEIELGRYEVAFQIFMERNPKAASQYGDIISEETE